MTSSGREWAIRRAVPGDLQRIVEFNRRLAWETESMVLEVERLSAGVAAVLADSSKGAYYVAAVAEGVIGQLMLTYEWSDWRNGTILWLQSVYVDERYRRDGVFRSLLDSVMTSAKQDEGIVGIRLYVEHQNARARAAYARLGFCEGGYHVMQNLWSEDSVPTT